jgi:pyruvate kinase
VPIVSLSPDPGTARRLTLLWGTHSVIAKDIASYDEMVESARAQALGEALAAKGDRIVVVAGIPFGHAGSTNNLRVVTL